MPDEKDWQKIEDWIVEKVKKDPGNGAPLNYRKYAPREEPELDYQIFLEEASRSMIRFKKPEHLIRMIARTIDEQVKTTHTSMLVHSQNGDCYLLVDSKGTDGHRIPMGFIKLTSDNPLIRFFNQRFNFAISDTGSIDNESLVDTMHKCEGIELPGAMKKLLPMVIKHMELLKANIAIPVYYKKSLLGVFILGQKLSGSKFSRQEVSFFTTLANDVSMAISNAQLIQDLQEKITEVQTLCKREHKMFIHTAISLAATIDARDPYTHGHTERVTEYSLAIAEELDELPEAKEYSNFKETLHIAALLHDVGKIGIPDSILNKTSHLTKEEYERVKTHPTTGATILYPIRELDIVAAEVRAHHERFDGSGYPDGLKADEIPFIARIIAVADTYDAITSDRPYRQRKMTEIAVQIIKDNSGSQFDPIIVSAFLLAQRKGRLGNKS